MAESNVLQGLVNDIKRMDGTLAGIDKAVAVLLKELEVQNITDLKKRVEGLEHWRSMLIGAFVLANIIWGVLVAVYRHG